MVEIFQFFAAKGSGRGSVPWNFSGSRTRGGHAKSNTTSSPSLRRILSSIFSPYFLRIWVRLLSSLRQSVFTRLPQRIQYMVFRDGRLSAKLKKFRYPARIDLYHKMSSFVGRGRNFRKHCGISLGLVFTSPLSSSRFMSSPMGAQIQILLVEARWRFFRAFRWNFAVETLMM